MWAYHIGALWVICSFQGDILATVQHVTNLREHVNRLFADGTTLHQSQDEGPVIESGPKRVYGSDELDLLAFFFTLVKILYIAGALDLVRALSLKIGQCPLS